jgi:nitrate reductase beta subunit
MPAAATERKSAASAAPQRVTHANKELEAMTAYMKKVTSSKKASQAFLENAGIVDKQGRLAKPYRP